MPMDELLEQLEALDETMLLKIDLASSEEWADFVDERQSIVEQLVHLNKNFPLTVGQKEKLNHIQQNEEKFRNKMIQHQDEAAMWLRQRGQAKARRNAYEAPSYAYESILMDKRK